MCSKKVAGIALVVNGVILIALGVIVGLLLPNMVLKTIEDLACVNSKESSGYKLWVGIWILFTFVSRYQVLNFPRLRSYLIKYGQRLSIYIKFLMEIA